MKKKLLCLLLTVLLSLTLLSSVSAAGADTFVYDNEGILSDYEVSSLEKTLGELSGTYGVDVIVVTTSSLGGKDAQEFADDFYDQNGFGQGSDNDGLLLLLSKTERVWAISTCGYAIYAFPDIYLEYMSDEFLPYLSGGDWYGACVSFAESCEYYLAGAQGDDYQYSEDDFSGYYDDDFIRVEPVTQGSRNFSFTWLLIALAIGLVVGLVAISVMKHGMKNVRMQTEAANYIRHGSFVLSESRDTFLYSTVSKTPIPKNDDDDHHTGGFGSGGHFSSTHVSSGGVTHGGRSGSF